MNRRVNLLVLLSAICFSIVGCSNKKIEVVKEKYEQFYQYNISDDKTIDLRKEDSILKTSQQANEIIQENIDGKKTARREFLDAWESLSKEQKNEKEMKQIQEEYKKIIEISQAYKVTLEFYENVKNNITNLETNHSQVIKLNDKNNMQSGARGKAIKEYSDLSKINETEKNSQRVRDIRQKYLDTTNYLDVIEYIKQGDIERATQEAKKIKDKEFKHKSMQIINS